MQASNNNSSSAAANANPQRKKLIAIAALIVLAAAVPAVRHVFMDDAKAAAKPDAKAVPVQIATVKQEALPITITGIGNVLAAQSVTLHSRIDGQLDSVHFKEGQDVRAGQLLVQLDDRVLAAQVQQAEAQRARDEAQLANAEADLTRYTGLVKDEAATQQQLDTQRALVRQLQATVRNDAAALNAARVQLSFTRINAPIDGRVGARLVDVGNIVHAADPGGLLVINQIDPIMVQFSLPEASFQAINAAVNAASNVAVAKDKKAAGKKIAVQAIDRETHQALADGDLVLLNNQIDTTTGTVLLKAQFKNPQHKLWPGQQVDAKLVLRVQDDALTAPSAAVQRSQQGLFVYVVEADGVVRAQPVKMNEVDANRVQITEGLKAGERVVTDGQYRLMPGARVVQVSDKPAKAATAKAPMASSSASAATATSAAASGAAQ
ncbi:MAG TPA: efflux RND transporter periplasmic adaptor subunit [Burkholderiaceae bacterium]